MILAELRGVKRYQDLSFEQLLAKFAESGYKYLSRGRMAYVFKHPHKDEVLKIWVNDAAYERFVEIARKWHKNKHMPKFLTPVKELTMFHKRTSALPAKAKWVRMEELHHANTFRLDGTSYPVKLLTVELEDCYSYDDERMLEDLEKYFERITKLTRKPVGPELKFFAQTAMSIADEIAQYGAQPDFTERNVMARADGTPVITDPGGFGEEFTMAEFLRKLELEHGDDEVDTVHKLDLPNGSSDYRIIKGKARSSDYDAIADKLG